MAYIDSFKKKNYQISDNPIHFNLNLENLVHRRCETQLQVNENLNLLPLTSKS